MTDEHDNDEHDDELEDSEDSEEEGEESEGDEGSEYEDDEGSDDEPEESSARDENRGAPPVAVGTRALGIERYVQFGFIAGGATAFWLFDKIVFVIWDEFQEPQPVRVALVALLLAIVLTAYVYKRQDANAFAHEAASELSKVTWPTRRETWSNTVVVVITSIIAAAILFVFDAAWSAVTDLIYKG